MEVHHHPDLHHKKKEWKEYLLEFLMIFIAVTLGFLAENLREHITERAKEKKYMEGFVRNLKDDTAKLRHVIDFQTDQTTGLDSLLKLSGADMKVDSNRHKFYYFVINYCYNSSSFVSNDATLQQLKSTGDYRLIEKDHVADSLANFEKQLREIHEQGEYYKNYFREILGMLDDIIDITVFGDPTYNKHGKMADRPFPALRYDDKQLKTFFNKVYVFQLITGSNIRNDLKPQLESSIQMLEFIKEKYDID